MGWKYTIYYTDGEVYSFNVTNGVGIGSIEKTGTSEDGLIDTYTVSMTDGTSYTFTVTNGKDGQDGVGVEKIEKTGTSEDGLIDTYTITLTNGETFSYTITNGKDGKDGQDGNGVASIEKIESPEGTDPNVDTYLIKMTNGDMYTFTVRNGKDGVNGKSAYELAVENGFEGDVLAWLASLRGDGISILGIVPEQVDELTMSYTFEYSDGTRFTFYVKNGEKGDKGDDGRGIESVEKTETEGNVDTYTVTYTDGTTSSYTVTNGEDGKDGKQGEKGDTGATGATGATGSAGATGARGASGKDGADGKDGKDGKDGVSIINVRVVDGDLLVMLSDGKEINAGHILTESQTVIQTGEVKTFFFKTESSSIQRLTVNGKEISQEYYTVEKYGDGTRITVSEEVFPSTASELRVETAVGSETVHASATSSVPWWIIYLLLGWNTLLTGGVVALAVTRKKGSKDKDDKDSPRV